MLKRVQHDGELIEMVAIKNIVILTGAGISAESGIDTFRSAGGLWEQHRVEDVATPEAFARDPDLVLRFYDMRRERIQQVEPNAAHYALAELDKAWRGAGRNLLIVTQNVDDLHERAGAERLIHMHGEHLKALCQACEVRSDWRGTMLDRPPVRLRQGKRSFAQTWCGLARCHTKCQRFMGQSAVPICLSASAHLGRSIQRQVLFAMRGGRG